MKILLYIFILIALYHFVYQGILLPSIRMRIRFKLFEIRDELRLKKQIDSECCSDQAFSLIQDNINNALSLLPRMDVSMLYLCEREMEQSESLMKQVEHRMNVLNSITDPEILAIRKKIVNQFNNAICANTGGWFIYVIPIILIRGIFRSGIEKLSTKVVSAPNHYIERPLMQPV